MINTTNKKTTCDQKNHAGDGMKEKSKIKVQEQCVKFITSQL